MASQQESFGDDDDDDRGGGGEDERQDGFGIEALTIVRHMTGKEDLVINTDLRGAE